MADEADSIDEQDSESSGDEDDSEGVPRRSGAGSRQEGESPHAAGSWHPQQLRCASYCHDEDTAKAIDSSVVNTDLACLASARKATDGNLQRMSQEPKPLSMSDGRLAGCIKKEDGGKFLRGGGETPPEQRQSLSRAGSQDEDDLFNVGCNHTASEMLTSLGEARQEYHLHMLGCDEPQHWGLQPFGHHLLHGNNGPKASSSAGPCTAEAERFLLADPCDDMAGEAMMMAMTTDCNSRSSRLLLNPERGPDLPRLCLPS